MVLEVFALPRARYTQFTVLIQKNPPSQQQLIALRIVISVFTLALMSYGPSSLLVVDCANVCGVKHFLEKQFETK